MYIYIYINMYGRFHLMHYRAIIFRHATLSQRETVSRGDKWQLGPEREIIRTEMVLNRRNGSTSSSAQIMLCWHWKALPVSLLLACYLTGKLFDRIDTTQIARVNVGNVRFCKSQICWMFHFFTVELYVPLGNIFDFMILSPQTWLTYKKYPILFPLPWLKKKVLTSPSIQCFYAYNGLWFYSIPAWPPISMWTWYEL